MHIRIRIRIRIHILVLVLLFRLGNKAGKEADDGGHTPTNRHTGLHHLRLLPPHPTPLRSGQATFTITSASTSTDASHPRPYPPAPWRVGRAARKARKAR